MSIYYASLILLSFEKQSFSRLSQYFVEVWLTYKKLYILNIYNLSLYISIHWWNYHHNLSHKRTGFSGGAVGKETAHNAGVLRLIPGLGRSPGGGHGNQLQYSCQDNPHRGTWRAAIHWGRKKSEETERLSTAQHVSMNCRSVFLPSLEKSDFFFFGIHNTWSSE